MSEGLTPVDKLDERLQRVVDLILRMQDAHFNLMKRVEKLENDE